ncbi:TPA: hypothetical protein ACF7ZB_000194 [Kluyvera georgiana]
MNAIKSNPFSSALLAFPGLIALLLALVAWKLFSIDAQLDYGINVSVENRTLDVIVQKDCSQY